MPLFKGKKPKKGAPAKPEPIAESLQEETQAGDLDIVKTLEKEDSAFNGTIPQEAAPEVISDAELEQMEFNQASAAKEAEEVEVQIENVSDPKQSLKVNRFDLFFLKVWSVIVAAITKVSEWINVVFRFFFKKQIPLRYVKAFVSVAVIVCLMVLMIVPFTGGEKMTNAAIFSEGLLPVQRHVGVNENGNIYKWGYANKKGEIKIDCVYEDALPFCGNAAFVKISDTSGTYYTLINKKGKILKNADRYFEVPFMERPVGQFDSNTKLAWVYRNGKFGFVNTKGKVKIDITYDDVGDFISGLARVSKSGYEYFINTKGKTVGDQTNFEVRNFSENLAAVRGTSGWGFMDTKGKIVIAREFDQVSDFQNGVAFVKRGNAYGIIDNKGKYIVDPNDGNTDLRP